ncbi:hypothetical protein EEA47_03230 [Vibrio alginolyticus]|nr:hypothetical protein EEA47_03230 [Vibrio alginolyticus]
MARTRVESNIITSAVISGHKGDYKVFFDNESAKWQGENLVLSSSRQPYEPRIFKSIDGAMAEILRVGLTTACVKIERPLDDEE